MERQEAIRLFREHWKWLSENPLADKEDYPLMGSIMNSCYLCEYCGADCNYCPIDWADTMGCFGGRSLFSAWYNLDLSCLESSDVEKNRLIRILPSGRAIIARRISELPERK